MSENAKNATATDRLQQLARPKSARLKANDYDPYKVCSLNNFPRNKYDDNKRFPDQLTDNL